MQEYKYKFSVIMPIYNVEKYLEDAIKSVINQTINFEKNIQLILVNDGSEDDSYKICELYKAKYPNNIIYIEQENAGVSVARNTGLKYVEGKYVNFLDSDDKWNLDVFEKVWDYFEKKQEEIDIVACKIKFFEATEHEHALDYKFKKTMIVNIFEKYTFIQLSSASAFFKSEIFEKEKFNSDLRYAEDAELITRILFYKGKYGVLSEAVYLYRRRNDGSSAVQSRANDLKWYNESMENLYKKLIDLSIEKYGKVISYIQYLIMYEFQWRIKGAPLSKKLSEKEKEKYILYIIEILQYIEDYIIFEQKNIYVEHKLYILSLKYGRDIRYDLNYRKGSLYFNNLEIYKIKNRNKILKIDILEINKGILHLEGKVSTPLLKECYRVYINKNSEKELLPIEEGKKSLYGKNNFSLERKKLIYYNTFKLDIPLKGLKKLSFEFQYKDEPCNKLALSWGNYSKISGENNSYYAKGKYLIYYNNKKICVRKNKRKIRILYELRYDYALIKNRKSNICFIRWLYFLRKKINKKEIWLISDRVDKANDNSEHFFKYVKNLKVKNIKPCFLINGDSVDYKRMKKIGTTIKYNSLKHKIYFLMASKVISSQADKQVISICGKDEKYLKDLMNFDFIFLQHGIIKDDLSKWLKKFDKNIKIFVTSGILEYQSIVNGDYYYTEKEVKLTGLPRYDGLIKLKNKQEKKVLIIPTWRWKLKNNADENGYITNFKNTEYFQFYNKLINDERILNTLQQYGYKCKFCLHPSFANQYVDFHQNAQVEINHGFVDYQKEFTTSSLLVTDFSSVFFDFAYLKKTVIYTQFDRDTFFENQIYDQGYFDYKKDGFGPVYYDYETTVQGIIDAIRNNCQIEQKYLERIENFYKFFDDNNCKRVYEEIIKL